MSQTERPDDFRSTGGSPGYPAPSGWVGWIVFAGVIMAMVGCFHIVQGLVALFNDDYYLVHKSGLIVNVDFTTWGWIHLIGGVILIFAGISIFAGRVWARTVGVIVAFLSAMANLGFMGAYPVLSILLISLDVIVIWALTVHGGEMRHA